MAVNEKTKKETKRFEVRLPTEIAIRIDLAAAARQKSAAEVISAMVESILPEIPAEYATAKAG